MKFETGPESGVFDEGVGMSNRRFSLVTLLLIVSLAATFMGWLVTQRAYQDQSSQFESLKRVHAKLRDETGQVDVEDPGLIYVRGLHSDVPNVYRFRVAVPFDTSVHLDCRYDVDGHSIALKRLQQDFFWSKAPGAPPRTETHRISELTIFLQKNAGVWTVKSNADTSFAISTHFGDLQDERLQWLDQPSSIGSPLGYPTEFFRYPLHSSSKSEEVVLQQIFGEQDGRKHVISFVLSPSTPGSTGTGIAPLGK